MSAAARIVIVGLGPGDPDLVTRQTLAAIERIPHRWLRTRVHPSAYLVPDASDFDHSYETADDFASVYSAIADDRAAAARRQGEALYAVPGAPSVLDRTVATLLERAQREPTTIECEVLPAVSFLDAVWSVLGIDPIETGARLIDGHRFAVEAAGERGPLLVAHVHADWVLDEILLAVDPGPDEATAATLDATPVTVLRGLGTPAQHVVTVPWSELRGVEVDHLTSLWIPELAVPVAAGYARSLIGNETGLELYYDFQEDAGTSVVDGSGNGRTDHHCIRGWQCAHGWQLSVVVGAAVAIGIARTATTTTTRMVAAAVAMTTPVAQASPSPLQR